MDFHQAVAQARAEQNESAPAGAKRIGETLGGLGVYSAPETLKATLEAAGFEYGTWQCRSRLDGSVIDLTGWKMP